MPGVVISLASYGLHDDVGELDANARQLLCVSYAGNGVGALKDASSRFLDRSRVLLLLSSQYARVQFVQVGYYARIIWVRRRSTRCRRPTPHPAANSNTDETQRALCVTCKPPLMSPARGHAGPGKSQ